MRTSASFRGKLKNSRRYHSSKNKKIRERVASRVQLIWKLRVMGSWCGYTRHFLTWEIALLPRETAFSNVTDVSRGKFPVLNIHEYVKKITRSAHDI